MDLTKCVFFGLKRLSELNSLLSFGAHRFENQKQTSTHYKISIINSNSHLRLIEVPKYELKKLQKKINSFLQEIDIPEYVFSRKNCSYVDNAKFHSSSSDYIRLIDIQKFFPNTCREKVYQFWFHDMNQSSAVANVMTNLTTVSVDQSMVSEEVIEFFKGNSLKYWNHLATGSPTSVSLSFLVNYQMFSKIVELCNSKGVKASIYVDDITLSSNRYISNELFVSIRRCIFENGYTISTHKCKNYGPHDVKKITGVIIKPNGEVSIPNSLRKKYLDLLNQENEDDEFEKNHQSKLGIIAAARQIENNFPKKQLHK